jgi:hypothetical protein
MYVCYIDESGTPEIPGSSSHYVLAGFAIPVKHWRALDKAISEILDRHGLAEKEFHTAWIMRSYLEQSKIANFEKLDRINRRIEVERLRAAHLLHVQATGPKKKINQVKKNFTQTNAYIHLTFDERKALVNEVADKISGWKTARLFAECIDKTYFAPALAKQSADEQAFEQIVSRFEQFLKNSEDPKKRQKIWDACS